jgi:nucleotide-binding universal stress UspA family protein
MVDNQLRSVFARWSERTGLPEQIIVRKGRLSDLIVLTYPDPVGTLDRALDAALFETGRPVLIVPEHAPKSLLGHVVVAWNGSLEATRAIVGVMPLLYEAERVTVLTTPGLMDRAFVNDKANEDMDLARALIWHGIRAGHFQLSADESSVGAALLQAAKDQGATLLVMGAYTHSRVTAAFLGGVTGHVLRNPPAIPVMMAH